MAAIRVLLSVAKLSFVQGFALFFLFVMYGIVV